MRTARAAGQWERIQRTKDTHPSLLYQLGPSKEHRPEHVEWHGLLLHVDDPFWREHFPPNGWGCKCWVRQVSRREAARLEKSGITAPEPKPVLGADGIPTGHVDQSRKVPVRTERPKAVYVDFKNKRTGVEERVPKGIDPGFHRPPTQLRTPGGVPPTPPASPQQPAASFPFASREAEERMATFTARARDLARVPGVKDVGDIQAYMNRDLARLSNRWLKEWKAVSTDANAAAARVMMGDAAPYDGASGRPPKTAEEHGASFTARVGSADQLMDAMRMRYAATQAMLGMRRLKKMKLYRGLNGREADSVRASLARGDKGVTINLRPLSSWSTDEAVARRFGSVVVMAEIPVEQAFSHHRVDPALAAPVGGVPEQEVIVYSPDLQIRIPARRVKSL